MQNMPINHSGFDHSKNAIKTRLSFADGLRGLAAFWVVLYHLAEGHHIETLKNMLPNVVYNVFFGWGHLGVAIFFVLSGFVMALTAHKVKFDFENAFKFIARRLTRLAPPYYFAILIALLFIFIKSKALHLNYTSPSLIALLQHAVFAQDFFNTPQINIVFWTLCIEVQFYIAFAMLVWFADSLDKRLNIAVARNMTIIATCFVALLWPLQLVSTVFWQGGFIGFWYSFLTGVIICWGWLNKGFLLKTAIIYCAILLCIGMIYKDSFTLVVAITASLLLFAGLKNKMHAWLNWGFLQWLGLISYSLYLLHNPITGASANIARKIISNGLYADILSLVMAIFACLVTAYLSFLIVERPSIQWSHRLKLKK
ncbi:MAG: acyltransferase [Bdellovibrio sp.]|nr:acyltransferase [Methylotenera sp.]